MSLYQLGCLGQGRIVKLHQLTKLLVI